MRRDSWRSVPEHVQAAELADLVALAAARGVRGLELLEVALLERLRVLVGVHVLAGPKVCLRLGVAAEHDVDAPPGHVGRHGDRAHASGLRDDVGLAEVVLRVQHFVGDARAAQVPGQHLGLLDADGADEDGLAALVALGEVGDDGVELGPLGLVDEVGLVGAGERPCAWAPR